MRDSGAKAIEQRECKNYVKCSDHPKVIINTVDKVITKSVDTIYKGEDAIQFDS